MENNHLSKEIKLLLFYVIAFLIAFLLKFVGAHGGGYDTEYLLTGLMIGLVILPISCILFLYHLYKYFKINSTYGRCLFIHIFVWITVFAINNMIDKY